MKKTYINPNMDVVNIKTTQYLLSGSPKAHEQLSEQPELSRRFDFDFFDDED